MEIFTFILEKRYQVNTYLVIQKREAVLIDPSKGDKKIIQLLKEKDIKLTKILLTHGHLDHISGVEYFKRKTDSRIFIHKEDAKMLTDSKKNLSFFMGESIIAPLADKLLCNGETIKFGQNFFKVLHTPGHTKGSVCFLIGDKLFSGDTLFAGGVGRTDFPSGSHKDILTSIKSKLFTLPKSTLVFPGHGPKTTIKKEILTNPFFN